MKLQIGNKILIVLFRTQIAVTQVKFNLRLLLPQAIQAHIELKNRSGAIKIELNNSCRALIRQRH